MKHFIFLLAVFLVGCGATKTVTPLGNQKIRVDVSAPSSYTRAEAQNLANKKAAEATLENGYDRFLILSGKSWTETEIYSDTYGTFSHDPYYNDPFYDGGEFTKNVSVVRNPETTMIVKMIKSSDKNSDEGVDARAYLDKLDNK